MKRYYLWGEALAASSVYYLLSLIIWRSLLPCTWGMDMGLLHFNLDNVPFTEVEYITPMFYTRNTTEFLPSDLSQWCQVELGLNKTAKKRKPVL